MFPVLKLTMRISNIKSKNINIFNMSAPAHVILNDFIYCKTEPNNEV